MIRCCLAITAICIAGSAFAAQERDPLAEVFGTLPSMWGVRISPDGSKVSFLQMHPNDMPVALVADPVKGEINLALASVKDEFDLRWCEWASDERLLCGFEGISSEGLGHLYALTRLVAVDADGRNMKVLLQNELRGQWAQFQDKIVDYLVVDYVEYPEVEHQIRRNRYRIDMLTRVGAFLDDHIGAPRASASAPDGAVRE
jgi:hypothetical protein